MRSVHKQHFAVLRQRPARVVHKPLQPVYRAAQVCHSRNLRRRILAAKRLFEAFKDYKDLYDSSVDIKVPEKPEEAKPQIVEPVQQAPAKPVQEAKPQQPKPQQAPAAAAKPQPAQPPVQQAKPAPAPAPKPSADSGSGKVLYGTQISASSRTLDPSDRFFHGLNPMVVKLGSLNKYIAGVSESKEEAKAKFDEIRSKFPEEYKDAFMVVIKDGTVARLR